MTHQNDKTLTNELTEKGLKAIRDLLRVLINNVMRAERSKCLEDLLTWLDPCKRADSGTFNTLAVCLNH